MAVPSPVEDLQIADVRRGLVKWSQDLHTRSKEYLAAPEMSDPSSAASDAFDGLSTASSLAWTLSAVMRFVTERHPDTGFQIAAMVETAVNAGTEWLDDANDDLYDADGNLLDVAIVSEAQA